MEGAETPIEESEELRISQGDMAEASHGRWGVFKREDVDFVEY